MSALTACQQGITNWPQAVALIVLGLGTLAAMAVLVVGFTAATAVVARPKRNEVDQ